MHPSTSRSLIIHAPINQSITDYSYTQQPIICTPTIIYTLTIKSRHHAQHRSPHPQQENHNPDPPKANHLPGKTHAAAPRRKPHAAAQHIHAPPPAPGAQIPPQIFHFFPPQIFPPQTFQN
jgi:hypothetical protein